MQKEWRKELARDLIAFGSIPFLVITIARVSVIQIYYPMQFITSSVLFFILRAALKANLHAGIGVILVVFTSIFYKSWLFGAFAVLIYIGIIISLFYLKKDKREIFKGILFGALSAAIGYFIVKLILR
jgi:hypothetical protein